MEISPTTFWAYYKKHEIQIDRIKNKYFDCFSCVVLSNEGSYAVNAHTDKSIKNMEQAIRYCLEWAELVKQQTDTKQPEQSE